MKRRINVLMLKLLRSANDVLIWSGSMFPLDSYLASANAICGALASFSLKDPRRTASRAWHSRCRYRGHFQWPSDITSAGRFSLLCPLGIGWLKPAFLPDANVPEAIVPHACGHYFGLGERSPNDDLGPSRSSSRCNEHHLNLPQYWA